MSQQNTKQTLECIASELNKIQTIAGTLSTVESQHSKDLLNYDNNKLNQIANEEQSAARQLGEVKQICTGLVQKIESLKKSL